jgi:hypothetical protein
MAYECARLSVTCLPAGLVRQSTYLPHWYYLSMGYFGYTLRLIDWRTITKFVCVVQHHRR